MLIFLVGLLAAAFLPIAVIGVARIIWGCILIVARIIAALFEAFVIAPAWAVYRLVRFGFAALRVGLVVLRFVILAAWHVGGDVARFVGRAT